VAIDQQFASLASARVALEAGANAREVRKIYQNDSKNDGSDA
jgi:hypothetical protein